VEKICQSLCDFVRFFQVEKVRQSLLLRDHLIAAQCLDEVRSLDRNLLVTSATAGAEQDGVAEEDDKYSLLSPKERLRCASEMEKSVDSSAVTNGDAVTSDSGSNSTDLMMRCIRVMQCKRLSPSCIVTSEVALPIIRLFAASQSVF